MHRLDVVIRATAVGKTDELIIAIEKAIFDLSSWRPPSRFTLAYAYLVFNGHYNRRETTSSVRQKFLVFRLLGKGGSAAGRSVSISRRPRFDAIAILTLAFKNARTAFIEVLPMSD